MKLKVLLILILVSLISSQKTFSDDKNNNTNQLPGKWDLDNVYWWADDSDHPIGPTSITPGEPSVNKFFAKASIWSKENERKLEIEFYKDYNNITLILESNNNVLYKIENINIKAGDILTVDITELPSGAYTLRGRTTANQTTLKGEFCL